MQTGAPGLLSSGELSLCCGGVRGQAQLQTRLCSALGHCHTDKSLQHGADLGQSLWQWQGRSHLQPPAACRPQVRAKGKGCHRSEQLLTSAELCPTQQRSLAAAKPCWRQAQPLEAAQRQSDAQVLPLQRGQRAEKGLP